MATTDKGPWSFLEDPYEFGIDPKARWKAADWHDELNPQRAASYYQHLVLLRANPKIKVIFNNVAAFAKEIKSKDETGLRKKLRGERVAQMDDYLAWAYVLGRRILPDRYKDYPKDDRSDLFVPVSLRARTSSRIERETS